MRFSTLAAALTSASLATARITGFTAPSTISPNGTFPLTLLTEGYIQAVADVAVTWSFQRSPGFPGTIGTDSESAYLGPEKSNIQRNITIDAKVPEIFKESQWRDEELVLTAAVVSVYGASGGPSVTGYNVSVKFGDVTGGEVKTSRSGWQIDGEGFKEAQ